MSFISELSRIINSGQSRSVILHGNIHDLFYDGQNWVPLIELLKKVYVVAATNSQKGISQVVYQTNRPIEIIESAKETELADAWKPFDKNESLYTKLSLTLENPTYALELLRQMTVVSRKSRLENNLLIIIDAAEMLIPHAPISSMNIHDRKRIATMQDLFKDPEFMNGHDNVILIAESLGGIHERISRLPQVLSVEIPLPDNKTRWEFIRQYAATNIGNAEELADKLSGPTSGLSIHAINQLLRSNDFTLANVTKKVEEYMISQLGEGVVEFKRPTHTLNDVIGFSAVKNFMRKELIPSFMLSGKDCISGVLVGGPIGGGKTFICEAVASEIQVPVITLNNIRSKWYGETDEIFERLKRLLVTFNKIVVFVDEADTQFGGVDSDQDVERRLTGKIQAMMSDPALRGRVIWFLMTARIHKLSPDIRRPGRMDVIIPILDPYEKDASEFRTWAFGEQIVKEDLVGDLANLTHGYSPSMFSMVKTMIKNKRCQSLKEIIDLLKDIAPSEIAEVRKYQTLQAILNCTRKSLVCDTAREYDQMYSTWQKEIVVLELKGIK